MPPIGRDWMQGRALEYSRSMLQNLGDNPQELDGAVKSAVTILKNSNRPIDLRIRTVVFLSYSANAGITLPTKEVLIAADELVKESLRDAYGIIQNKKFEAEIIWAIWACGGMDTMSYDAGNPIEGKLSSDYLLCSIQLAACNLADSMTRLVQQPKTIKNNKIVRNSFVLWSQTP